MYITYETVQYAHALVDPEAIGYIKHSQPPKKVPNDLPKPDFMPIKLVPISDIKVVHGSQANGGSYALSYSWNQSRSIFYKPFRRKYVRFDKGKHKIIRPGDNREEKRHEICNMYHIIENAYCTIALVQENINVSNVLRTLEEARKSKRLIFVGRDIHLWGEDLKNGSINHLTQASSQLSVTKILYHAHQRTSTKDHDRVFAPIQLFPEFIDRIYFDYDQKLEDLIQFYGLFAKKDISILFFWKEAFL
ncbi:hypothetical protein BDA99DRAFT_592369 [Phascolomyces articulosus]|uniref:Uncharacterized protein n=1 Tax=Phascolomyces articulosus TaxID=60185 RepID=A0AAD5JNQ6_9FUNG|nr:hypothetical protein BDA99DRAFT_592369 [Phascolomyces articulosus]